MVICEACQAPIDGLSSLSLHEGQQAFHLHCLAILLELNEEVDTLNQQVSLLEKEGKLVIKPERN